MSPAQIFWSPKIFALWAKNFHLKLLHYKLSTSPSLQRKGKVKMKNHFIIFHRPVIKKILIAGRKCYTCSCNTQVSMFIDVWQWMCSLFLVFSVQTKPKKHFNAEIRLPYSNWFDHLKFLFLRFKLFISSWSLWNNSTHPDKSSRVKNSKVCRRTKYGNWIRSQVGIKYKCWKSKADYFC